MIPTNPTNGADGHSGASASNSVNANPTNGADASNGVNTQEAQPQGAYSFARNSRPVLTLEEMGKIAVAASEYTYLKEDDPVSAIARFYNDVSEFFEGMNFFRAERGSLLLRVARPFLEDPTIPQEEKEAGWALVRTLIENMMIQLDNQALWTIAAGAASRFRDYSVYL